MIFNLKKEHNQHILTWKKSAFQAISAGRGLGGMEAFILGAMESMDPNLGVPKVGRFPLGFLMVEG